jgi:hypothetical protein
MLLKSVRGEAWETEWPLRRRAFDEGQDPLDLVEES